MTCQEVADLVMRMLRKARPAKEASESLVCEAV